MTNLLELISVQAGNGLKNKRTGFLRKLFGYTIVKNSTHFQANCYGFETRPQFGTKKGNFFKK